ncbi:M20/M25/M40 family metallo-hydrolase [Jatrophihabitans sp.]|uniref:M20/M25/M40 family metallo-hydrolase n=1 Tax=Jatrophihabitans sp. TaxID=1932789 RepID=UPI002CA0C7EA|nr:M20/M25/M40 family metallo-hydrolase [Jatrophihabitans sp.]
MVDHSQGPALSDTRAVRLLRQMLEIASPSYSEAALAGFLAEQLPEFGFATEVDAAGNVVGELSAADGPTVMLLGHLDTVPGHVPVREQDGRLYGRGAVDAKTPLAAMICAAARSNFAGRLVVVGAVEEETPLSRGALHILDTHRQPDALIIGEPSGWHTVVLGYKGKLDFRYRVSSAATHPTNPVPKASELAVDCWQRVCELLGPEASHARFDQPGPSLVSITADQGTATAHVSVRMPLGFDPQAFLTTLRARLTDGEIEFINSVPACRVGRNDPVVRALTAAIRRTGSTPVVKVKTATSDMNTLAEQWHVPMATYGPGDSVLDHADDEHVVIAEYLAGIDVLSTALTELTSTLPQLSAAPGGAR